MSRGRRSYDGGRVVPIAPPGRRRARLRPRAAFVVCTALLCTGAAFTACSSEDPPAPPVGSDTGTATDAGKTDAAKDATSDSTPTDAGDTGGSTKPPPIEDTGLVEDFGTPVPGAHVEATIGPSGGTLEGTTGPLAGVKLVVPAGALSAATLLALDALASPGGPTGALVVSPFVRVGPETVLFSVPARLTLPWKSASADPQLAVVARSSASFTFSGLVEPVADATSITVSLGRGTGAEAITLSLTTTPSITAIAPSTAAPGAIVFVEGTHFGIAPVVRPLADAGALRSQVTLGGTVVVTTGWSDTALSVRMPAGDGGVVAVTTPGGTGTGGTITP